MFLGPYCLIFLLIEFNVHSSSTGHGHRSNLAPQSMQWAIRNRETGARAGGREAPCPVLSYSSTLVSVEEFLTHKWKLLVQTLKCFFKWYCII
jgi:hypothetical protein